MAVVIDSRLTHVRDLTRVSCATMFFSYNYDSLLAAWGNFLKLPYKQRFTIDLSLNQRPDHGFFVRDGKVDGTHDQKDTFHFRTNLPRMYGELGVEIVPELRNLLNECGRLYLKILPFGEDLAKGFDQSMEGIDALAHVRAMSSGALVEPLAGHVIRLVSYNDPGDGILAEPHVDHSFLTFHLWDSHPGLMLGRNHPSAYRSLRNRIAVFPGKRMAIRSRGRVGALSHFVSGENVGKGIRRTAIIFFLHTDDPLEKYEQYKGTER